MEEAKHRGEAGLTEKQEKVQIEIEKVLRRVEEFEEYGDMDAVPQYVKDLQSVQKRVAEIQDQSVTINKVGIHHTCMCHTNRSVFPLCLCIFPTRGLPTTHLYVLTAAYVGGVGCA